MSQRTADEKMLECLELLLPKLQGIQKQSAEYRINCLKEKLENSNNVKKVFLDDLVSKYEFCQKMEKERNLIDGYTRILLVDQSQKKFLEQKRDFSQKKLALLNSVMKQMSTKEDEEEHTLGKKINGTVKFQVESISFDPLFKCVNIDFFIDSELKKTIDVQSFDENQGLVFEFGMENNRDFEIVFTGENDILLGIIFFSCDNFLKFKKEEKVIFAYLLNAQLATSIKFEREVKLIRKNAEIICVYKEGHALENLKIISPIYCAVCDNLATLSDMYRCYKCKLTCHKRCANYILFFCPLAPKLEQGGLTKRYNIPHDLELEKASGFRYCSQCGTRIKLGSECKNCTKCSKRFHMECAQYIPPSCGIAFDLRKGMANFNPPLPEKQIQPDQISVRDFKLLKVLGRGAFGKVMLVTKDKVPIAMKILKKEMIINSNNIQYLELERHILKIVSIAKHPFLMQMLYCFQDESNVYFGTEFLAGGDLFHYASKFKFTHPQIKLYACEIILGLEYLHSQNIIYRDMKLDNVLICADGHIKIADFGLCKDKVKFDDKTNTFCGTADTLAPDVISQGGYTKDVDWWSFGVVLYEMFENELPFNGSTTEEITKEILETDPKFTDSTPEIAKNLICLFLQKDPKNRIGYGEEDGKAIRKHEYFEGIDWTDVMNKKITPEFIPKSDLAENFDDEFMDEPIIITPSNSFIEYDKYFVNFHQ